MNGLCPRGARANGGGAGVGGVGGGRGVFWPLSGAKIVFAPPLHLRRRFNEACGRPGGHVDPFEDEIDISRGDMLVRPRRAFRGVASGLGCAHRLDSDAPLNPGRQYDLKLAALGFGMCVCLLLRAGFITR